MDKKTISFLDNAFWRFSLHVYSCPRVQNACLLLQNEQHINVNLLLFCCWLAYAVEKLNHEEFTFACQSVENWHAKVTIQLRNIRKHLKNLNNETWLNNFYNHLLTTEILSESYQQHCLFESVAAKQKKEPCGDKTLTYCYLTWLIHDMNQSIDRNLESNLQNFMTIVYQQLEK